MPTAVRESRLKREYAHLYPEIEPEVWVPAASVAPLLRRDGPQHFELRSPERAPYRLMLIDDSRVERVLLRAALLLPGEVAIRLSEADDLDLGLSLLLQRRFDLILLDEDLPGVSREDALRAIRGVAPTTPIIHHTTYLDDEAAGLDLRAEGFGRETRLELLLSEVWQTLRRRERSLSLPRQATRRWGTETEPLVALRREIGAR
jgi:DNA-binding NtrC family response regulator